MKNTYKALSIALLLSATSDASTIEPKFELSNLSVPTVSDDAITFSEPRTINESFDISSNGITGAQNTLVSFDIDSPFGTVFRKNDDNIFEFISNFDLRELDQSVSDFTSYDIEGAVLLDDNRLLLDVTFFSRSLGFFNDFGMLTIGEDGELSYQTLNSNTFFNFRFALPERFVEEDSVLFVDNRTIFVVTVDGISVEVEGTDLTDFGSIDNFWANTEENILVVSAGEFGTGEPLMRTYEYSLVDGRLSLTLISEVLNETDGFDDVQIISSTDPRQFSTYQESTEVLTLYEINENGTIEVVRAFADTSDIVSSPVFFRSNANNSVIHEDILIVSDFGELFSIDISTPNLGPIDTLFINDLPQQFLNLSVLENQLFATGSGNPTQEIINNNGTLSLTALNNSPVFNIDDLDRAIILQQENLILTFDNNTYFLYDISSEMPVLLDELESQGGFFSPSESNGSIVSLDSFQIIITDIIEDDGSYSIQESIFPIFDLDGNSKFISTSIFEYDGDNQRIVASDFGDQLFLLEQRGDQYVVISTIADDISGVTGLEGIQDIALVDSSVYVYSRVDNTISHIEIENDVLNQIEIFDANNVLSDISDTRLTVTSDRLYVKTESFIASFDTTNSLSLLSISPALGDILYLDNFHSIISGNNTSQVFRVDQETGVWNSIAPYDLSVSLSNTRVSGNAVYQRNSFNPAILSVLSIQRAPVSLRQNNSAAYNQGETGTIVLSDFFVEVDENDEMTISVETDVAGLTLTDGVLVDDGSDFFGEQTVVIRATDLQGQYSETNLTIDINRRPQVTLGLTNIDVETNESFNLDFASFVFDDQDQTVSFAIESDLPGGVTLEGSVLSGSVATAISTNIEIIAIDNLGAQTTIDVVLNATAPPAPVVEVQDDNDSGGGTLKIIYLLGLIGFIGIRRRYKN